MPPSLLVVEPDPARAAAFAALAREEGFEPVPVADGERALALADAEEPPALLLCSLSLPRLDGFALLRERQRRPRASRVPVVAVSAWPELRRAALARRAELGIAAVLPAHCPVAALRTALRNATAGLQPAPGAAEEAPEPAASPDHAERAREADRRARIAADGLADLAPDERWLSLAREAADRLGAPVGAISLLLEDKLRFLAQTGLEDTLLSGCDQPRAGSLCARVAETNEPLVVPDAASHPLLAEHPALGGSGLRGYAGVPIATAAGEVLGTLAVMSRGPLAAGAAELRALQLLARRAAGELERAAGARTRPGDLAALGVAADALAEALIVFGPDGRLRLAGAALARLAGLAPASQAGLAREAFLERLAAAAESPSLARELLAGPPAGPWAGRAELELVRPQRRLLRWSARPVELPDGTGQLEVLADATAERELARQRETLALADALTGLPNRRAGEEALVRESARSRRALAPLALALLDIDHLWKVNEAAGHEAGDEALRAAARSLRACTREADFLCRWGGDEFLVILPATDLPGARRLAERVQAAISAAVPAACGPVTLSAGTADVGEDYDAFAAVRRAEARLWEARATGRNRVV